MVAAAVGGAVMGKRMWIHHEQLALDIEPPPPLPTLDRPSLPKNKLIAMNDMNRRIGEDHGRASLSNHDIELIVSLLEARNDAIETSTAAGMAWDALQMSLLEGEAPPPQVAWSGIAQHLAVLQLSYRCIAEKMECSIRHVRDIDSGRVRSQVAARWKRVPEGQKGA